MSLSAASPRAKQRDPQARRLVGLKLHARTLLRAMPQPLRDALRLAPAFLTCSFDTPKLRGDGPGLDGARVSARFGTLAQRLKMPSITGHQSGRRLCAALLVLHDEGCTRLLVQPAEAISNSMIARIAERVLVANEQLERMKLPVRFEVLSAKGLDTTTLARLDVLGGLICGRPAKWLLDAMEKAAATVTPALLFDWVPHGPTAQCRVQLLLGEKRPLDTRPGPQFASALTLRRALLLAQRRTPFPLRAQVRAAVSRELLPGGIPICLVPALSLKLGEKRRPPVLTAVHAQHSVELRLPDGTLFARARTLLQARVRAMLLARAVWGKVPEAWLTGPQWHKLAERLSSERNRCTFLFAMGPDSSALASRLITGREPRMRELDAAGTLKRIIASAAQGHAIEVIPCSHLQQLETLRLSQLALRAAAAGPNEPVAVREGENVLLYGNGRFQTFRSETFYQRPRRALVLDAPPPSRKTEALGPAIEIDARGDGKDGAWLMYRSKGWAFRERVTLDALAAHLRATEELCRSMPTRTVLVLQADEAVQRHLKAGRTQVAPTCAVGVRGDLKHGLTLEIGDQTFTRFRAAAETVLSRWQIGVRGHIEVQRVDVGINGSHGDALLKLYVRAAVMRRLSAHIGLMVGLKARADRDETYS